MTTESVISKKVELENMVRQAKQDGGVCAFHSKGYCAQSDIRCGDRGGSILIKGAGLVSQCLHRSQTKIQHGSVILLGDDVKQNSSLCDAISSLGFPRGRVSIVRNFSQLLESLERNSGYFPSIKLLFFDLDCGASNCIDIIKYFYNRNYSHKFVTLSGDWRNEFHFRYFLQSNSQIAQNYLGHLNIPFSLPQIKGILSKPSFRAMALS